MQDHEYAPARTYTSGNPTRVCNVCFVICAGRYSSGHQQEGYSQYQVPEGTWAKWTAEKDGYHLSQATGYGGARLVNKYTGDSEEHVLDVTAVLHSFGPIEDIHEDHLPRPTTR